MKQRKTISQFVDDVVQLGTYEGFVVNLSGQKFCSQPENESFSGHILTNKDYNNHEGVFFKVLPDLRCLLVIAIHNTNRGQSEGGTRIMIPIYESIDAAFSDVLRLSRGMTEKIAWSGGWRGGGKALIVPFTDVDAKKLDSERASLNNGKIGDYRKRVFEQYGLFVASLRGAFIAAEDMNTEPTDFDVAFSMTPFVSCKSLKYGGSGNPSPYTALGVYHSMRATVEFSFPKEPFLKNKRVLLQGLGNVGATLFEKLISDGAEIIAIEKEGFNEKAFRQRYPNARFTLYSDSDWLKFITTPADIFSPNGPGGILTAEVASIINVKIIVGAANNQLYDNDVAKILHDRGIIYVPDFSINHIGIENCSMEARGYRKQQILLKAEMVYEETSKMLRAAKSCSLNPLQYALKISEQNTLIQNPCYPGHTRGLLRDIIDDRLTASAA